MGVLRRRCNPRVAVVQRERERERLLILRRHRNPRDAMHKYVDCVVYVDCGIAVVHIALAQTKHFYATPNLDPSITIEMFNLNLPTFKHKNLS